MLQHLSALAREIGTTFADMAPYLMIGLAVAGVLHVMLRKDFVARHLGSDSAWSVVKAALLGVPLPLCSCGVVPTALSLRKGRASEGAVMSFLVSTPQTGVDSIVATYGMMGPVFAVFRPMAALLMGIGSGLAVRFGRKTGAAATAEAPAAGFECVICSGVEEHSHGVLEKVRATLRYAFGTFLDDIALQLVVGIVVSGLISFFVPDGFFERSINNDLLGMGMMVVVGIPLYVCATASIPIALALMLKGLSPGAAFVFLAVGPVTNAASMVLITRAMGKRFMAVYLLSTTLGAILAGFVLNAVFGTIGGYAGVAGAMHQHHAAGAALWKSVLVYAFAVVLVLSISRRVLPGLWARVRMRRRAGRAADGATVLGIQGMTCSHCAAHVREAIAGVDGVNAVSVDLSSASASYTGTAGESAVREAVVRAGYKAL